MRKDRAISWKNLLLECERRKGEHLLRSEVKIYDSFVTHEHVVEALLCLLCRDSELFTLFGASKFI